MRYLLLTSVFAIALQLGDARPSSGLTVHADKGPSGRIVGGIDATDGQWPSQLSLEYFSIGAQQWTHICGAVLYNTRYALTAAHCVDGTGVNNLRLWGGLLDRRNQGTSGQLLPILSYIIHPGYNASLPGIPNNLAIIVLAIPADTSRPNIGNAVLPPDAANDFNHGGCFATGYGRTATSGGQNNNILQWVQLPAITNGDCSDRVYNVDHIAILDTHLCILSDPPGNGPCNGDAGGPLYCYASEADTSAMYLAGVNSWNVANDGTCNLQYPTVLTRVGEYLAWIQANAP